MKTITLCLISLCLIWESKGQISSSPLRQSRDRYRKYEFVLECPMRKSDVEGRLLDSAKFVAPVGSRFVLVYAEKDWCIIRFLLNTRKNRKKGYDFKDKEMESYKYYRINQAQLDFKTVDADFRKYVLTVGNVITPIKLRVAPFNFSKDFTVGPTFGIRYTANEYSKTSLIGLFGIGISSVTLDSFSTEGAIKRNIDLVSFTPSLGFMLEFGSAQVGIFSGFDILNKSNEAANYFRWNGIPWISVGFGYALFSTKAN